MDTLEYWARYGLIDIFFGLGVLGVISRLVNRVVPSNLDELHVSADFSTQDDCHLLFVQISNAGGKNVYISRAYFKPKRPGRFFLQNKNVLAYSQYGNFWNLTQKFYELRFGEGTREYDCLLKPEYVNKVNTALRLESLPKQSTGGGNFGKVEIEYATYGKQGRHVVPI